MSLEFKEDALCEGCGKFGAFAFAGGPFCGDCYETHGSCCSGAGAEAGETSAEPTGLNPAR